MPSVEGHIVCSHTDFVTKFLYFATKSWTLTGSCALISLIIARVEFETGLRRTTTPSNIAKEKVKLFFIRHSYSTEKYGTRIEFDSRQLIRGRPADAVKFCGKRFAGYHGA